jgi:lipopolysaccharide/colanic/teichoic acid biosynthesis glycosyltransferase
MGKRFFDLAAVIPALCILAPFLLIIALLIKLDSKGPAIYVSPRYGRKRRLFRFYKFRTMRMHADRTGSPLFTTAKDPRITRLGSLLRQLKLDELPQLWNVLTGDMSLVGPRPEVPAVVDHHYVESWDEILSVRPGLTCLVQLDYPDFSHHTPPTGDPHDYYLTHQLSFKVKQDLEYVRRASFGLDLWILLRTVYYVILVSWLRPLMKRPRPRPPKGADHPPSRGEC